MKKLEIINILKETNYTYYGIRGMDEELEIGQELDTSYLWDYELDQSTYGQDNEEDLGGVCTTNCTTFNWANYFRDDEELEEMAELILKRIKYNTKTYSYNHTYLVGGNEHNKYNMPENDEYEMIINDAVIVAIVA